MAGLGEAQQAQARGARGPVGAQAGRGEMIDLNIGVWFPSHCEEMLSLLKDTGFSGDLGTARETPSCGGEGQLSCCSSRCGDICRCHKQSTEKPHTAPRLKSGRQNSCGVGSGGDMHQNSGRVLWNQMARKTEISILCANLAGQENVLDRA